MTTPRERQVVALNTMMANLQRLYVFEVGTARLAGVAPDESRATRLRREMDAVGKAIATTLQGGALGEEERRSLRLLASWLKDEVDLLYLAHDASAPLRERVAFGTAHIYAADNRLRGEQAIAAALGRADEADWLLQRAQQSRELVQQANAVIDASVRAELDDEHAERAADHLRAALAAESQIRAELDGVPALLAGHGPGS